MRLLSSRQGHVIVQRSLLVILLSDVDPRFGRRLVLPPACWSCQLELIQAGTASDAVHRRRLNSRLVPSSGVSIAFAIDCIAAGSEAVSAL
jgi:hypothetical protein